MITRARPEVIITTHRRSTSLPIMSASTMGDCLNTALDNIFISCPIIELINEVYTPAGNRRGRRRRRQSPRKNTSKKRSPPPDLASDFHPDLCSGFPNEAPIGSNCCLDAEIRELPEFVSFACPSRDIFVLTNDLSFMIASTRT